ncbi:MAG: matrixin family metalloprotease [Actinobacteria bacterium]|nr:matrixin family metalloprotease [Actinomycetota bacterium]
MTIQNDSPFATEEEGVDDDFSVILWHDPYNTNQLAETHTYPNDLDNSTFYGPNSNQGVDVWFNYNIGTSAWYFNQTPPASRTSSQIDFVEILAHELGHGIGLQHVTNSNSIMYPAYSKGSVPLRNQSDGDLAGRVYQHTVSNLSGTFAHSMVFSANTSSFAISDNLAVPSECTF